MWHRTESNSTEDPTTAGKGPHWISVLEGDQSIVGRPATDGESDPKTVARSFASVGSLQRLDLDLSEVKIELTSNFTARQLDPAETSRQSTSAEAEFHCICGIEYGGNYDVHGGEYLESDQYLLIELDSSSVLPEREPDSY